MAVYRMGNHEVDLQPYVKEAVETLGYVRSDAIPWLEVQIARYANRNNGRSIREAGTRITPDERVDMGLQRWDGEHLSREVLASLTEKGLKNPVEAFDNTCTRALYGARQYLSCKSAEAALGPNKGFAGALVSNGPRPCCDAGIALNGWILPTPPVLPLAECTEEVCGCHWRLVTHREAKTLER